MTYTIFVCISIVFDCCLQLFFIDLSITFAFSILHLYMSRRNNNCSTCSTETMVFNCMHKLIFIFLLFRGIILSICMVLTKKRDEKDVAIIVENVKLWVARGILASFSSVLCKMLCNDKFKEKDLFEIPFPDEKLDEFVLFLRSIIPRPVLLKVSGETVELLLFKANYFDVPHLMAECCEFLINNWANNVTKVKIAMSMGCKYMQNDVINKCTTKFIENKPKWDDDCWLKMPKKLITFLCLCRPNVNSDEGSCPNYDNSSYQVAPKQRRLMDMGILRRCFNNMTLKCISCDLLYDYEIGCGIKCIGIYDENGCGKYLQHYCQHCDKFTMCNVETNSWAKLYDWFN